MYFKELPFWLVALSRCLQIQQRPPPANKLTLPLVPVLWATLGLRTALEVISYHLSIHFFFIIRLIRCRFISLCIVGYGIYDLTITIHPETLSPTITPSAPQKIFTYHNYLTTTASQFSGLSAALSDVTFVSAQMAGGSIDNRPIAADGACFLTGAVNSNVEKTYIVYIRQPPYVKMVSIKFTVSSNIFIEAVTAKYASGECVLSSFYFVWSDLFSYIVLLSM